MKCTSCDREYHRKHGYGNLSFGKGETDLEQLESWTGPLEVCVDCANVLRAWLKMDPFPKMHEEEIHPEPFSCWDERLSLYR